MEKVLNALPARLSDVISQLLSGTDDAARSQRGALMAFAIRIASAAIAFLSQVLLARWMGTYEFGVYTYIWVWLCVIGVLAPLGTSTTVVRFIPEYLEHGKAALARGFLRFGRLVSVGFGLTAAIIGALVLLAAPDLIPEHYHRPLAFMLLCLPGFALVEFMDGIGRARGRMDLALIPGYILRPLLLLIVVAMFALASSVSPNAEIAVAALVFATWTAALVQYLLQRRHNGGDLLSGSRSYDARHWVIVSAPVLLMESFALIMMNFDILVLEFFVEPDQIAIYFAAIRTISLVAFVQFAVSASIMSRFASAHARHDANALGQLLNAARKWTFVPSAIGLAMLLALGKPILWLFGPEFVSGYPVMFILAIGILARAAAGPAQGLLVVTGRQNITAAVMVAAVVLNAILNLTLIPRFGLLGAAAATASAFVLEAVVLSIVANQVTARPNPHGTTADDTPAE